MKRVPVRRQLSGVECGAACLAMILSHHGRNTEVQECRDVCQPGRDGLTARTIVDAARRFGLRASAYSLEPQALGLLPLPVILHWNFNHFVVLERIRGDRVDIVDPAGGRRTITKNDLDQAFTGVALTFEPGVHFEKRRRGTPRSKLSYAAMMLRLPGVRRALTLVVAASLVLQLLALGLPLFTKLLIDHVIPLQLHELLGIIGVGFVLVVAAQGVVGQVRGALLLFLRARVDSKLVVDFFEHLLSLPFSFFQTRSSGDVLLRVSSISYIREVLTGNTLSLLLDGTFAIGYLAVLAFVSPRFALLAVVLAAAQLLVVALTRGRVNRLVERELAARSAEQSYLVEAVIAISLLKASGTEDRALDRWSSLFHEQLNVVLERGRLSTMTDTAMTVLRSGSSLLLLWSGAQSVVQGDLTLGAMFALVALTSSFLTPIASVVANGQQLLLVGAHLERIADVLEAEPEPVTKNAVPEQSGSVEVRDLSFRYAAGSPPVLSNVSFNVDRGRKIALVGATGSGKSTLAMLLVGLHRPTSGEIFFDGVPLADITGPALRRQLGVVLQEPFIFSGSIAQNIRLANPDAPMTRVMEVAAIAGLHDEIAAMPMQYETIVAEGGTMLSGGQRQRLALARALLCEPRILLLDEATSHLDAVTEEAVDRNLSRLQCTRIVVAHRLSTIRDADQILVLDRGRLVERGTHDSLLALGGTYAALVRAQRRGENTPAVTRIAAPFAQTAAASAVMKEVS
ncbi:MAG TPA: peptidase domain-containing ABC transporter [Thermoanaerobaculia bacterium]|jgi:ABC-type bacteriocin/lantibiotic exporter with double-glycine peptidase domain